MVLRSFSPLVCTLTLVASCSGEPRPAPSIRSEADVRDMAGAGGDVAAPSGGGGDATWFDPGPDLTTADAGSDAGVGWTPIDDFVATAAAGKPMPAVAAVVFDTQGPVVAGVTGVRKMGDPTLATIDDKFHLGSCTKAMTAVLAARLVERGIVSWSDKVVEVLDVQNADPAYVDITLIELMSHTAGMPGELGVQRPALWQYMWANTTDPRATRAYVADALLGQPPAQPIGTYTYANAGFIVAGATLEAASDVAWEDLMRSDIFEPLGMTGCGFGPQAISDAVDQPWPHRLMDGVAVVVPTTQPWDNPAAVGPAGLVHCPILDWAKFGKVHLGDGGGFITPQNMDLIRSIHAPDGPYGLGWLILERPWGNGTVLTHAGSNLMNHAVVWVAPEVGKGVMVTTNVGGDGSFGHLDDVVAALIREYF